MVFGQKKIKNKSNKITGIPLLLIVLHIPGSIVTIDPIGCQKEITHIIRKNNKADYCIALKDNQPTFLKEMVEYARDRKNDEKFNDKYTSFTKIEKDHGRIEQRTYTCFNDLSWFHDLNKWEGLKGLVRADS